MDAFFVLFKYNNINDKSEKYIFQVLINLNDAKDIIAPLAIYIAQLAHLFLQFWQAQFLLDYSAVPYEAM